MNIDNISSEWPQIHEHHKFHSLSAVERLTISLVYFKVWRGLVNNGRKKGNERAYFKHHLKEIHAQYFLKVVSGPSYVKTSRLILNYLISKANENIRAVLLSLNPYNLSVFVHAIRSQIELNALVNHFIVDPEFHQKFIALNEDRSKVKEVDTVLNVNTLVSKLGNKVLPYQAFFDEMSLLLHPNPSAIKFYAQAEGTQNPDGTGLFQPQVKHYFDRTITPTKAYDEWFTDRIWLFLSFVEHYLLLLDSLSNDFFFNGKEKEQFNAVALTEILSPHMKEILRTANEAANRNEDMSEAVNQKVQSIFNGKS